MPRLEYLRRLWVLMATVFLDMMGYLLVLPLLPFYAKEMNAPDWMVGVLLSSFAVAQLTTAPLWGWLSDHVGRRPVILGSLVMSMLAFMLFGVAQTVWVLLLSRLFQGMGGGTIGVVQAYVSDTVPPKARTEALGWVTVATSVGVMLGPGLGSWSIQFGTWAPGFLAAGLCLVNLVFAWFLLPEAQHHEGEEDEPDAQTVAAPETGAAPRPRTRRETAADLLGNLGQLKGAFLRIAQNPGSPQARLIWIYALSMMGFMAMNGVMVLYLERVFGFVEENIGYFYVFVGAVSFLMRGLLLGPIVNRLGETKTLRVGAVAILLSYFLIPLTSNEGLRTWMHDLLPASFSTFVADLILLAPAMMLIPVGTALLFPATTSLVSQKSSRRETGQTLGVQQAFGGVARVLGPLWATAVFQFVAIDSPFWINVGLMVLVVVLTLRVREEEPAEEHLPVGKALEAE
jgi:multidrug resistance protein